MIFTKKLWTILFFPVIVLTACTDNYSRLPRHTGLSGEVFIIMEEEDWNGAPGDSLRYFFQKAYPALPQAEPLFKLFHIRPAKLNKLLKHHRNIIQIEIGNDTIQENKVFFQRDRWSSNQLYFNFLVLDKAGFYEQLRANSSKIINLINTTEISRIQSFNRSFPNRKGLARIKEKYGISLALQEEYYQVMDTANFMWFQRERVKYLSGNPYEITQGIFVFSYPYTSDTALVPENALAYRDQMLEKYIKGGKEGTYMTTEYRIMPPTTEIIELDGRYTLLSRGLWRMENYFMGGPFMSLTTLNHDHTRVISVSGYTFAPKFDKREFIREIEATLRSVQIAEYEDTTK